MSSEIRTLACPHCPVGGRQHARAAHHGEPHRDAAESKTLCMRGNSSRENREILLVSAGRRWRVHWSRAERSENVTDGNAEMNANRKSDEFVVPATSANNDAAEASAESTEERNSAKRNAAQAALRRTPSRTQRKSRGLHGVPNQANTGLPVKTARSSSLRCGATSTKTV